MMGDEQQGATAATLDVRGEAKKPFLDIREEFEGAIVYLDGPAAEIVQWTFGGLDFFFGLGAEHVTLLPSAATQYAHLSLSPVLRASTPVAHVPTPTHTHTQQ
jgi:hypothetical protein